MSVNPVIIRARALIGTRFRLHGRTAETGLDCVGLVALAHDQRYGVPTGYTLRSDSADQWRATLSDLLEPGNEADYKAGDVLLMKAGPAQYHLGIWTGESLIHAHAQLQRVVETPGTLAWPVIGIWHQKQGKS